MKFTKKRLIKALSIILLFLIILFIVYKIDSVNRTEKRIVNITRELMDAISTEDYDKIRRNMKNIDGTDLSDQQISNFLLNTQLYRTKLIKDKTFTYLANANFFNTNKGNIMFDFKTLNGELITNKMEYVNTGVNEYLTTDKVQDCNKEKEKYSIAVDLANEEVIGYNGLEKDNDIEKIKILSYVQDENGKIFVEIIKEAEEDIKINLLNIIHEMRDSLKQINENYDIEWDNECKEFSIYYDESVDKKVIVIEIKLKILSSASLMQVLDGNENWHLTINYYDYNTRELLKTELIR